jgi:putative two-component system response regulator
MDHRTGAKEKVRPADILVVDDTVANLTLLTNMLKDKGYRIRPVTSGRLALKQVESEPPDLILLDITMPGMNGYEVCEKLKSDSRYHDIPIIFISALSETLDKVKAFSCGGVDYITKPFQFEEVEARLETHLKLRNYQISLEEMVKEKVKEISDAQISTIFGLSKLAESRDHNTGRHLERVRLYCRLIAEKLGEISPYRGEICGSFISNITNASTLHDIGKVAIPDHILLKEGRLSADEFAIMKTHPLVGAATLEEVNSLYPGNSFVRMGTMIARSHHERWDGSGYPEGLAGEDIPLSARILAVADVFDALSSRRPYKEPLPLEECCRIIVLDSGAHFDPIIVEAFKLVCSELGKIREEMD